MRNRYDFTLVGSPHQKTIVGIFVFEPRTPVCSHHHQIQLYLRNTWITGINKSSFQFLPFGSGIVGVIFVILAFENQALVLLLEHLSKEFEYLFSFLWVMHSSILSWSQTFKLRNIFPPFLKWSQQDILPINLYNIKDINQNSFPLQLQLSLLLCLFNTFEFHQPCKRQRLHLLIKYHYLAIHLYTFQISLSKLTLKSLPQRSK